MSLKTFICRHSPLVPRVWAEEYLARVRLHMGNKIRDQEADRIATERWHHESELALERCLAEMQETVAKFCKKHDMAKAHIVYDSDDHCLKIQMTIDGSLVHRAIKEGLIPELFGPVAQQCSRIVKDAVIQQAKKLRDNHVLASLVKPRGFSSPVKGDVNGPDGSLGAGSARSTASAPISPP